jgi:hypothetical protein
MGVIVRDGSRMIRSAEPSPWRWRALTPADWRLLAAVAVAQIGAAAALRAMPLLTLRTGISRVRRLGQFFVRDSDERIAWAIEAVGRRLGRVSTCLIRALVAELVLNVGDGPVSLTIGVKRTTAGTLEAHAWVTRHDRVLIGATSDEYIPLATWTRLPA